MGPRSKERRNQLSPLRFLPWAIPAFSKARVPQPTKYCDACSVLKLFRRHLASLTSKSSAAGTPLRDAQRCRSLERIVRRKSLELGGPPSRVPSGFRMRKW